MHSCAFICGKIQASKSTPAQRRRLITTGALMPDSNKKLIRVILADDHQVVRRGIRDFLTESGEIEVVAEADNGDEAVRLIEQHHPDVAVLDIQMPGRSGIEVVKW